MNLDNIVKNLAGSGVLGGLAGGAVSGALMSNKKARKAAGTALKVGGLAALGGLAYKAYQGYQNDQQNNAQPAAAGKPDVWSGLKPEGFEVDTQDAASGSRGLVLVQAMIAAAYADGHMDAGEREKILQQLGSMQLDPEEKAIAYDALSKPLAVKDLCEQVNCPELATEVYLASLVAMDRSRLGADIYLEALAFRLGLPQPLVEQLNNSLPEPMEPAA